jgi:hypothetical protein
LNLRLCTCEAGVYCLFALVILEIGSHLLPRSTWTTILFYTSHHHWDDRCILPHPAFFCWHRVSQTILPGVGLPGTVPPFLSLPHSLLRPAYSTKPNNWLNERLANFLPGLVLSHYLPDLSFPSSYYYRHEPSAFFFF